MATRANPQRGQAILCRLGAPPRNIPPRRSASGLDIDVMVIDEAGKEIGTHRHPLLWHPYLYHYGRNWVVPGDGTYSLRVRFPAPQFHRHDKTNGNRFAKGADVTFEDVELGTGRD